ncbi:hypothetical protein DNFV4_03260 [Nitrospira tepida]|uniref:Lipoprotein n=1 Tax=Nitrospira tepida TaxID=2973512 RepID=A0AA86N126_9BACT|nr:DUF3015 family protein [Nitrospira tepida]CAI4032830.1 hypothetical protein DNFV4_03260 [Nitrospira tepida]
MRHFRNLLVPGLLLALSGCTTDATVELTKAPFEATSALSDGTSRAIGELLEPISEFTSSTTPGASAGDSLLRARQRMIFFTAYSYDNLRADIARGSGEYVTSLATLAGVPQERHEEFRHSMRSGYATLFDETITGIESSRRIVDTAWAMRSGNDQ